MVRNCFMLHYIYAVYNNNFNNSCCLDCIIRDKSVNDKQYSYFPYPNLEKSDSRDALLGNTVAGLQSMSVVIAKVVMRVH